MGGPAVSGAQVDYARLRRWPDVEAENLFAYDAGDPLLLETAVAAGLPAGREIVVVNDHYGALTLGLAAHGATGLRVHQDALSGERAIDANAARLGPELGLEVSAPTGTFRWGGSCSRAPRWCCCNCRARWTRWTRSPGMRHVG